MKNIYTLFALMAIFTLSAQNKTTVSVDMSEYTGSFEKVQIQVEQEGWGLRDVTQDTNNSNVWSTEIISYGDAANPAKVQYKWAVVNNGTATIEDLGANSWGGKVDRDFVNDVTSYANLTTAAEDGYNTDWYSFMNRAILTNGTTAASSKVFYYGSFRSNTSTVSTITLDKGASSGTSFAISYNATEDFDQWADVGSTDNGDGTFTAKVRSSATFDYIWVDTTAGTEIGVNATLELANMEGTCGANRNHAAGSTGSDTWAVCQNQTQSINNAINFDFDLYPNPVKKIVFITAAESIDMVRIFDLTGRMIKQVNPNSTEFSLNVENLSKGAFLVKLNAGNKEVTTKFIK